MQQCVNGETEPAACLQVLPFILFVIGREGKKTAKVISGETYLHVATFPADFQERSTSNHTSSLTSREKCRVDFELLPFLRT